MGKRKTKEQEDAEDLFVEQGWTAKAIADFLKVQPNTVSKWREAGKWDTLREELLSSPQKIKQIIRKEIVNVAAGNPPTVDADALSKLSKVHSEMGGKLSVNVFFSVMKLLDKFLSEHDPELAIKSLPYHKLFLQHQVSISE